MGTAISIESIDHLRRTLTPELLPRLEDATEVSSEETPAHANVCLLLRTRNPMMTAILQSARRAAVVPATILLIGENGAGKRLLARQIHNWSPSHNRRFVSVDCARISEALVEAETPEVVTRLLTGNGDSDSRNGHYERPGTIFLENIADLQIEAQPKLLNFAEAQRLNRRSKKSDQGWTRIVAASNRDLISDVMAKKFRADLFYRINVVSLQIPPLRDRPEDVLPFAESVLREEGARYGRPNLQFSAGAQFAIQHRSWLGNAPELASVIESAVILSADDLIKAEDLPELNAWHARTTPAAGDEPARKLCEVERNYIARVLASGVSVQEAAEILGISSATLGRKRKRYNLC
jgi:two-component system, NtrC family, response regulator AlgB